jgi:hypothetical protein
MTTGTEPTLTTDERAKRYSVDQKSRDLAEYFLGDDRAEETYRELAQAIQDCVEDFCTTLENAEVAAQEEALRDEPPEPDRECFRGGEYTSALAEEQARIQRELK